MPAPPKNALNVLVGVANLYLGVAALPGQTETPDPADTLAFDEAWLSPWYHPGYTDKGVVFNFDRKEKRHQVEEISAPVIISTEVSTMKISVGLAEATLENLMYAAGGGAITEVVAATGVMGKKTLKLSEDLKVVKLGFEGKNPQGFYRRVIIPRVVSTGKIKTEYDRSKNKQVYMAEFESVCAVGDIKIYDKTANAI